MKLQRLLSYVRKACDDYNMIQDGDKIAVGVSGGKDSLSLLYALKALQRFYPKKFEIVAITVSLGLEGTDFTPISELCKELGVDYHLLNTDIGNIIFEYRKESNPCSLCAKMRKGSLNDFAKEIGCNKIAYGHNKDDVIQTFFMSLFYEGRIYCFRPVTYWDRSDLYLIRPLIYVPEQEIINFTTLYNAPIVKNLCPVNGLTKREEAKIFVREQMKMYDGFEDKVFTAIKNSFIEGWKME